MSDRHIEIVEIMSKRTKDCRSHQENLQTAETALAALVRIRLLIRKWANAKQLVSGQRPFKLGAGDSLEVIDARAHKRTRLIAACTHLSNCNQ